MKLLFNIIAASLSAALLAACGSNSSVTPFKSLIPSNDAAANVRQSAPTFRVVHNFGNGDDGYFPSANMIAINGTLYGVTAAGGAYGSQPQYGGGTVFNVNAAGDEHVMYSFNPGQFYAPQGKLLFLNNSFYGTTSGGGKNGAGSVFTVGKNGTGRLLYSFRQGASGSAPFAGLINVKGLLYGTTAFGGHFTAGSVYSITAAGVEHELHIFRGARGLDGQGPQGDLLNVNGMLYGTTVSGGLHTRGTVFTITTAGAEHVLYNFNAAPDADNPYASLTNVNGTLYGTTRHGGTDSIDDGCGTIFEISTTGTEQVLHSFDGTDGCLPVSSLIYVKGKLYGTAEAGGIKCVMGNGDPNNGCGTVFSMTPSGTFIVLHRFDRKRDPAGAHPIAGLTYMQGSVYGTTTSGGAYDRGTVFAFTPTP